VSTCGRQARHTTPERIAWRGSTTLSNATEFALGRLTDTAGGPNQGRSLGVPLFGDNPQATAATKLVPSCVEGP